MLIFTPEKVKSTKNALVERDQKTLLDLSVRIAQKTHELNELTAGNVVAKANLQQEMEEKKHELRTVQGQVELIRKEIERLMEPITETKEQWEEKIQEVEGMKKEVKNREEELERESESYRLAYEKLEERWDEVENKADDVEQKEKTLKLAEKSVLSQTEALGKRISDASRTITESNDRQASKERNLEQREHALTVLRESFDKEQSEFWEKSRAERRQIDDQRATLERAMKQIKK